MYLEQYWCTYNRQKSSLKKVFGNNAYFLCKKVLWKKSLKSKVCGNKFRPSILRLYFQGLFSGSSLTLFKNVPCKKNDVYNHPKTEAWYSKHPWLYSIYRCIEQKSFYEMSQTWPHFHKTFTGLFFLDIFSTGSFNSCDLISWDFIGQWQPLYYWPMTTSILSANGNLYTIGQ